MRDKISIVRQSGASIQSIARLTYVAGVELSEGRHSCCSVSWLGTERGDVGGLELAGKKIWRGFVWMVLA